MPGMGPTDVIAQDIVALLVCLAGVIMMTGGVAWAFFAGRVARRDRVIAEQQITIRLLYQELSAVRDLRDE